MKLFMVNIIFLGSLVVGTGFAESTDGQAKNPTETLVEFTPVETNQFFASYYTGNASPRYGVLVVGGSEGGLPLELSREIAQTGRPVLALAYFKEKSLPLELNEIALEYFEAPMNWLLAQSETRDDGLLVVGWSKGAELALLMASRDRKIIGVAAGAPSSHVWAGVLDEWDREPSSSWTAEGNPIEYVRYRFDREYPNLKTMYESSLQRAENKEEARIPVENINGPVLLLSGGDDTLWPSTSMAKYICQTIEAVRKNCNHVDWPNAGHSLTAEDHWGGTKDANKVAETESKKAVYDFLQQQFSDETAR